MGQVTNSIETRLLFGEVTVPASPTEFARRLNGLQQKMFREYDGTVNVSFNKSRYFETSVYDKKLCASMAQAIKSKIQFGNMLIDSWTKLESLVVAFNKRGVYVNITVDWI